MQRVAETSFQSIAKKRLFSASANASNAKINALIYRYSRVKHAEIPLSVTRLTVRNGRPEHHECMKHHILGKNCSGMVRETHAYGLPTLEENPFSIRPLEAGESGKLIGRDDVFNRLQNYLRLRSARRVMLVGPLGSGRTSLARCLRVYSGAYATIDHLPAQSPATALLRMCYQQMIGGEPPHDRMELVNDLVNEMYSFNDKLPMIVIDMPASDLSVLDVALRDAHSSLERLNALLVLVCDVKERHQLPSTVIDAFETYRLSPFTAGDVVGLVRQRLASIGVMDSEFSMADATKILEECDGYPASVITILRDAVDVIRMRQSNEPSVPYLDSSAKIQPRDEPESLRRLMGAPEEPGFSAAEPVATKLGEEAHEDHALTGEVIDASTPWQHRDNIEQKTQATVPQDEPAMGFDLDFGELEEAKENDEPLQPTPFDTPIIDASATLGSSYAPVEGTFGNLARRNKDAKLASDPVKEPTSTNRHELVDDADEYQYWVNEPVNTIDATASVPDAESSVLLHDEVGFVEDSPASFEEDHAIGIGPDPTTPFSAITDASVKDTLSQLLALLQSPAPSPSHHAGLLAFFRERYHERPGKNESFALNKIALSSLNPSESYVISVAHLRHFSPSDESMLDHLGIKRARLSQISNRLLKNGILQVRRVGKKRKYSLTQAARAQLIAWGAITGGEAV